MFDDVVVKGEHRQAFLCLVETQETLPDGHGAALPWQVTLINYGRQWRTRLIYLSEDVLLI